MVKCTVINGTRCEAEIREGSAGVYRRLIEPAGGKYTLQVDVNATYREYRILFRRDSAAESSKLTVFKESRDDLILTSDDIQEYSEVWLQEGYDGAFFWKGTNSRVSNQAREVRKLDNRVSLKFDKALRSRNDLEKLCNRVKICPNQCKHLLEVYKEGIQKTAQLYGRLINEEYHYIAMNMLMTLEKVLDSLELIVCNAKELLGSCATELAKVALVVSIWRPPVEKDMEVDSEFDLLIRELEWQFDVIEYSIQRTSGVKFEWNPAMSRYVLIREVISQEKAPAHEKALTQEKPHDLDCKALQDCLKNGFIPSTIYDWCRWKAFGRGERNLNDTILKRCTAQDLQSSMKIDHLDLHGYRILAEGSFKKVYKGNWYGQSVAIATIRMDNQADVDTFKNEVRVLLQVQHPKVVSLFGWAETTDAPAHVKKRDDDDGPVHGGYIVTEKMEYSLDDLIKARKTKKSRKNLGPFSNSVQVDILLQIVEAMLYVHNRGIIHRDLKPGNILVNRRSSPARRGADTYYNVKVIDFGNSKLYSGQDNNTYNKGTTTYGAPEMMKGCDREADHGQYTPAVDVFSFAMTCYQVMTGKKPFQGMRINISEAIQNEQRPVEFGSIETYLSNLRELTMECWKHDPRDRPSFKEIQERLWAIKLKLAVDGF